MCRQICRWNPGCEGATPYYAGNQRGGFHIVHRQRQRSVEEVNLDPVLRNSQEREQDLTERGNQYLESCSGIRLCQDMEDDWYGAVSR